MFKVDFLKRPRMTAIGIGHSYVSFDFIHGKSHASHLIEFHFIKWSMTVAWTTTPDSFKPQWWNPGDKYNDAKEAQNRHRV